ncbi:MAG: ATP-binding region, ATPase-like:Histidine kinase N-terminal [Proteobacteria bacterium]|nr:ATP-binding region, ATPase-like:Histidine kinase N-terminal [Pseudomonadota bacterium]
MQTESTDMIAQVQRLLTGLAFVAAYILLDWASYLHPMYGLNITPWNPSPALGLVYWLRVGKRSALPWFVAILTGEVLVRGLPATLPLTLVSSLVLMVGYGFMAEAIRRRSDGDILHDRGHLLMWLVVVIVGTLITSAVYVSLLFLSHLIPVRDWTVAVLRFWVGDSVGIVVTMPFFWLLFDGRHRLRNLLRRRETLVYVLLAAFMLWVSFGFGAVGEFQYFYLLFLPIVWAAGRQGVLGAAIAAFTLQAGIIVAVQWQNMVAVTVFELQMLGAVLAFVGLFIGVVVDEKQRVSDELRQTLRLAAAGEMAAALAHELNQPLTALSAYGAACGQLLERGENGTRLKESIARMVAESNRAADVVRRLRDFFRTGATQLERIALGELIASSVSQFEHKARLQGVDIAVDPVPACTLLVDSLQLQVVLRNLLDNAMDAVQTQADGKRHVSVHTQVLATGKVCIRVRDSGPGLSLAAAAGLFEAFQSSKANGLGLGLVISRAIAEAHGGTLVAEPMTTGGLFLLTLPVEKVDIDAA